MSSESISDGQEFSLRNARASRQCSLPKQCSIRIPNSLNAQTGASAPLQSVPTRSLGNLSHAGCNGHRCKDKPLRPALYLDMCVSLVVTTASHMAFPQPSNTAIKLAGNAGISNTPPAFAIAAVWCLGKAATEQQLATAIGCSNNNSGCEDTKRGHNLNGINHERLSTNCCFHEHHGHVCMPQYLHMYMSQACHTQACTDVPGTSVHRHVQMSLGHLYIGM